MFGVVRRCPWIFVDVRRWYGSKFLMNRADMNHLIITVYAYANEDDFYATDYYLLNMIEIYFS